LRMLTQNSVGRFLEKKVPKISLSPTARDIVAYADISQLKCPSSCIYSDIRVSKLPLYHTTYSMNEWISVTL
jgi:hypothetical protein